MVISGIYIDDIRSEFLRQPAAPAAPRGRSGLAAGPAVHRAQHHDALDRLRQAMEHISRTGDPPPAPKPGGGGEPVEIAAVFNAMVDRFRGIVCEVVEGSQPLLAASCQLVEGAGRIQHGSFEQSDAATSSAAAVEEITTSASHTPTASPRSCSYPPTPASRPTTVPGGPPGELRDARHRRA